MIDGGPADAIDGLCVSAGVDVNAAAWPVSSYTPGVGAALVVFDLRRSSEMRGCSLLRFVIVVAALLIVFPRPSVAADRLERIQYNNPGLVVDLGVGLWAWPLPMDYDGDGDLDLVVSCPDKPYNGTYFFENPGPKPADGGRRVTDPLPVFKPSVRIADGATNVQVSYVDGEPVVTTPGKIYVDFRENQYANPIELPLPVKIDPQYKRIRANQWKLVDWDADGDLDVVIGLGVWDEYGWDDAWDENGNWTNGPLHGFVYLVENLAVDKGERGGVSPPMRPNNNQTTSLPDAAKWPELLGPRPVFAEPVKITTSDGNPVDVYGMPSPNLADFDGDGDLDLICGEFLDGFTYFRNHGTREKPKFLSGAPLGAYVRNTRKRRKVIGGIAMDLQMITPVAVDWDRDGDPDLVCGDEDGRVALIERLSDIEKLGRRRNVLGASLPAPAFGDPQYFRQEAADVKFGALVTPVSTDWDGDGDEDLICGNTAGYIGLVENTTGGTSPQWNGPVRLKQVAFRSGGTIYGTLRELAGDRGSIQGPCEAKWGYSTLSVADWNADGLDDLVVNGIWGKVSWFVRAKNGDLLRAQSVGAESFAAEQTPSWTWWNPKPGELATQWRTTPCVLDWNGDGLNDLVMLDHEGYLAFYERAHRGENLFDDAERPDADALGLEDLVLLRPKRIFKIKGTCEFDSRHRPVGDKKDGLLRLNANRAGASGRRKLHFVDWDGDGLLDLLVNSVNVNWLRNVGTDDEGFTWFNDEGPLDDRVLAGHTTSPTTVDWDANGIPDLLVGAEDGYLYYKQNPRAVGEDEREAAVDVKADGLQPVGVGVGVSADDGALAGVVERDFIYEDAPFPECHAATIAETPAGLAAAWFGGTHEKNKDVGIWVARKIDGEWTDPVEVADGVQHSTLRHPCWNPVLFQQPGGPLQLYYKCGPSPSTWWGMLTESADDGESWSWPRRLPETIDGPVKNKPVLLDGGDLLCGSSTEYDGWTVHFEITRDAGRTWERIGPINSKEEFNAIQPTILTHTDGRLQILCRSRENRITTSWSDDGGRSWSKMKATSLPNPNSGIDAVTLEDGRHLLIYNHTLRGSGQPRGRSLLNVAVSEDGENWQAALVLENEPGEFSYPAAIQTSDGLVHLLYTWKRQRVRHVVVDPSRLELEDITDGRWPGLPDAGMEDRR